MSFALTCFIHLSLFNFQGPFRRPLFRGDFVILPHRVPFVKTFSKTFFAFFFALLPVHLRGRRLTTALTFYHPFPLLSRAFREKMQKNPEFRFFRQKSRDFGRISLKKPGQTTWLFKTSESCSGLPAELIAETPRLLQSEKARALPAGGPSRARTLDQPVMSR